LLRQAETLRSVPQAVLRQHGHDVKKVCRSAAFAGCAGVAA
jgi:hypothetical protein